MRNSRIRSTGSYIPLNVVTNEDFETIMDTSDAWIQKRTGIIERRFETISTSHMALQAAKQALKGMDVESIDCIIVGTYSPDSFIPTVANQVRAGLGIQRPIPSFDVNAACSGFLYAYQNGHALIASGLYHRVLVIGADFNSRYLNFEDRGSAILFGDGAGAVVMEASEKGYIDSILGGETDSIDSIKVMNKSDGANPFYPRELSTESYFEMKGAEVFKFAVRTMETQIKELVSRNHLEMNDIDLIIAHQANQRILDSACRSLDYDKSKMMSNVSSVGNTSSASVPLLLDTIHKEGRLKPGMKIILIGFGGGLTYGAALLEWV